jgi:integrase
VVELLCSVLKSGFKTKAEAMDAGTKAMTEYNEAGLHFTPSEISFSDYLDYWVDTYCNINLKEVTVVGYLKKIRLHIKPELGDYKLKALSPAVLQKFINKMAKDNYARNTLITLKGVLSGCLSFAVKQEMIKHNPMNNVSLPSPRNEKLKPRTAPHVYIPPNRIKEIFERFPEGTSTHIAMMLGYKGGLRLGEVFGLIWEDVSFEDDTIKVSQQVQWDETKKLWYFSNPKFNSYRTIGMDKDCMELLKREKERQKQSAEYYAEHYKILYVNEDRQLNNKGDGKPINLVNVRENGEFIIPRTMQHTSGIIHYRMSYPEFDFHSLRHP